jgi:PKD domain/Secretion system C-terminal sorting domain
VVIKPGLNLTINLIVSVLLLTTSFLYGQTETGIAPGESAHFSRQHNVSILPVTDVSIQVQGEDSALVGAIVDSFRVIQGALKVKTDFTLNVSGVAPVGQLNIKVVFVYSAEGALTQTTSETFIINTTVQPSIAADFSADPVAGSLPLTVNFSSASSSGEIVGYAWDFGDSTTSMQQNPQHIYNEPGLYTVSLTVFNFSVQNKKTKVNYINAGNISSLHENKLQPHKIYLGQNYPNPFNPQTVINYYLAQTDHVAISLFDITGKRVSTLVNCIQGAGEHFLTLRADNLASGIYFYNMKTKDFSDTKKLIVNK